LRSNKKGNDGKTHYTDTQNNDTTAPSCRELYHLQFSFQVASPGTFGYTLLCALVPIQARSSMSYFDTFSDLFWSSADDVSPWTQWI